MANHYFTLAYDVFRKSAQKGDVFRNGKGINIAEPRAKREIDYSSGKFKNTKEINYDKYVINTNELNGKFIGINDRKVTFDGKGTIYFAELYFKADNNDIIIISFDKSKSEFINIFPSIYNFVLDQRYSLVSWGFLNREKNKPMTGISVYKNNFDKENKISYKFEDLPNAPNLSDKFKKTIECTDELKRKRGFEQIKIEQLDFILPLWDELIEKLKYNLERLEVPVLEDMSYEDIVNLYKSNSYYVKFKDYFEKVCLEIYGKPLSISSISDKPATNDTEDSHIDLEDISDEDLPF